MGVSDCTLAQGEQCISYIMVRMNKFLFWWDDDDICFVLQFKLYRAGSLKQQHTYTWKISMPHYSDKLSRLRTNKSLFLALNDMCLAQKRMRSPPVLSGVRVNRSLDLCVCFIDRCMFLCLCFFWPLGCLSFFDLRIRITPLVSSDSF